MALSFWTEPFFHQAVESLRADSELAKSLSGIETSILLKCSDRPESFLVSVAFGTVSARRAASEETPEFTLSAPYEEWVKIAKGQDKVQREIVRGNVKFSGSWPKMLLYINKVVRLESEMLKKMTLMGIQY